MPFFGQSHWRCFRRHCRWGVGALTFGCSFSWGDRNAGADEAIDVLAVPIFHAAAHKTPRGTRARPMISVILHLVNRPLSPGDIVNSCHLFLNFKLHFMFLGDRHPKKVEKTMDHHTSPQPAPASLLELPNAIQPLTPTKLCAVCGQEALKRCARCRITYYCCADCQDSDWSTHLRSCVERKPSLMAKRLHFDEDKAPLLCLLSDRTSTSGRDGLI